MHPATKLVKDIGIYGLCGTDGCLCMNCVVQGISIDISCRKSDAGMRQIDPDFFGIKLRVHTGSMDASGESLKEVAEEVVRQLRDQGYAFLIRYCDYEHDAKCKCGYCGKPREPKAYLCSECLTRKEPYDIAAAYDYTRFEFSVPEPADADR